MSTRKKLALQITSNGCLGSPVGGVGLCQSIHVVQVVVGGRLLLCRHTKSSGVQLASNNSCFNGSQGETYRLDGQGDNPFAVPSCPLLCSCTLIIPCCHCWPTATNTSPHFHNRTLVFRFVSNVII